MPLRILQQHYRQTDRLIYAYIMLPNFTASGFLDLDLDLAGGEGPSSPNIPRP
jgi:hypothetical protein